MKFNLQKLNHKNMKNLLFKIMALTLFFGLFGCKNAADPSAWSDKQVNKWFEKGEWLGGWQVKPDESINRRELAMSYFLNKERWDKAFAFLKENDLTKIELKRYEIDGNNLYAPVSEYLSKNEEEAQYEAHQKYIDIQYVVSGKELIGMAPASLKGEIVTPYNETKDVEFMKVKEIINRKATPDRFFIFFPSDLHRPGLKDGENSMVRKVVVKVKVD
jgi:biofilm protein TabA